MHNDFIKVTEQDSLYNVDRSSTIEILTNINMEDHKVAEAVKRELLFIEKLVDAVTEKLKNGGRLFYIGAGTSGRHWYYCGWSSSHVSSSRKCRRRFRASLARLTGL
jgi:hypothetical protein